MNDSDEEALNEAIGLPRDWKLLSQRYPEHFPGSAERWAKPVTKQWAETFERLVGRPPTTPIEDEGMPYDNGGVLPI